MVCVSATAEQIPASTRTIGIVSLQPTSGHLFHVALLRFGNECKGFDLKGANLDGVVYSAASAVLAPRYKIVRVALSPGAEIRTSSTEVMGAFKSFPSIADQIRTLARPHPAVDAYVLVWSRQKDSDCLDHPQAYGVGVTKTFASSDATVHAYGQLILIDAHTNQNLATVYLRDPTTSLQSFDWKDKPAEVSDQQMQLIRTAMQKVLGAALSTELRRFVPAP
jgi:hypothetical protein